MRHLVAPLVAAALLAAGCRAPSAERSEAAATWKDDATAARLRGHVRMLSETIGPRCGATNATYVKLEQASQYIQQNLELLLRGAEDRVLTVQRYDEGGKSYANVTAEITGGDAKQVIVVGAHYDSFCGAGEPYTPGADDNASGVAMLLELAQRFDARQRSTPRLARTLRFVAFANEEPPYFQTAGMGSLVYAQQCQHRGETVAAMLSLESLGYFADQPGSQRYPAGLERLLSSLPGQGDFLAIVGNLGSRQLVFDAVEAFRAGSPLPVEGLAAPFVPQLGWSDNWAFWKTGFSAAMVTDTAVERNPNYHLAGDTGATLDYRRMAMAVPGLVEVIARLAAGTGVVTP